MEIPSNTARYILQINEYQIVGGTAESSPIDVVLRRMPQIEGHDLWAIQEGKFCFNKNGEWEYEPSPSSRTDDYLLRCRFDSKEAALKCWIDKKGESRFLR